MQKAELWVHVNTGLQLYRFKHLGGDTKVGTADAYDCVVADFVEAYLNLDSRSMPLPIVLCEARWLMKHLAVVQLD